ncbi:MAG: N-acetyltransferase [Candidatus Omnitrophica bacterium]|nr:N-acetyltransferase [Candidatus Omnitrophota bacterium]
MTAARRVRRAPAITVVRGRDCRMDRGVIVGYRPDRAVEDLRLTLGRGARLRSGTVIYAGTTIGQALQTGHGVIIREQNRLGDDVAIWSHSVVDYGCRIGDHVRIHTNCYIAQFTVIEDGAFLAPGVTIANDPHPGCPYSRDCMRGPTIKAGAQLGINVTVLPYVTIGRRTLVGAGAVVTRDLPDGVVAAGNPARVLRAITELECVTGLTDRPYHADGRAGPRLAAVPHPPRRS